MALIVQKYGGTSVGSLERIHEVAAHIASYHNKGHKLVVVVSAMGLQTDELKSLAYQVSDDPPQRELDILLSAGERISMALLAIALNKKNVKALSMTGSQSGILTSALHGNAHIIDVKPRRILESLEKNYVVIVAGFQGMSAQTYEITTLGRGGSDLTAVALSESLRADVCEIYKDVDGVFNADPNLNKKAKKYNSVAWYDMYKYCLYGAGVLHHRAVALATKTKTNLHLLSSFDFLQSGTKISGESTMEGSYIIGITTQENLILASYQFNDISLKQKIVEQKNSKIAKQVFLENFYDGEFYQCFDVVQAEKNPFEFLNKEKIKSLKIERDLQAIQIVGVKLDLLFAKIDQLIVDLKIKIVYNRYADDLITIVVDSQNQDLLYQKLSELVL